MMGIRWRPGCRIVFKGDVHMTSMIIHSRSGPDSKLHLEVAVSQPDAEFEVEVVVRPKTAVRTFPPGYFDLIGSVADETLTVHPQPPLPPPVDVE
jgi:hypothetical protein